MESINLALKYFGLRAERAVAIGIHLYAIFYHIRTHTEPQPPPQRKKKQCAKSINEMRWNEMHSRFFPNLFFLSSFSFCCCEESGKKKRISSVTAAFLSLRNTNISLLCFLGTEGRWERNPMPTMKSIRMIPFKWHCIPFEHEFKTNKTEWVLFNFEIFSLRRNKKKLH